MSLRPQFSGLTYEVVSQELLQTGDGHAGDGTCGVVTENDLAERPDDLAHVHVRQLVGVVQLVLQLVQAHQQGVLGLLLGGEGRGR